MNTFSEQIDELRRKFAKKSPLLAPQFPLYLITALTVKRDFENSHFAFIGEKETILSHGAYDLVWKDDRIDVAAMSNEEYRSAVMGLIGECADYVISNARMMVSDPKELRRFTELWAQTLVRAGEIEQTSGSLPAINLEAMPNEKVMESLLRVVREATGEDGSISFKTDELREEDCYVFLRYDMLASYFHTPGVYERLKVPIDKLGGAFNRVVQFAEPKEKCALYTPLADALLAAAIDLKYPGRIWSFTGSVASPFEKILTQAIAVAYGLSTYLFTEDVLFDDEESIEFSGSGSGHDLVVALLPHQDRIRRPNRLDSRVVHGRRSTRSEYAYVEYILSTLNDKGRAVVAVSERFLYSPEGLALRISVTENDLLERVFAISAEHKGPESINTAIIVLNKAKETAGVTTFDGDGDRYVETTATTEEIRRCNGDWRPSRHAYRDQPELRKILDNSRYPVRRLREFVDSHVVGTAVKPTDRISGVDRDALPAGEQFLPFVRVSDLLKSDIGRTFRPEELRQWTKAEGARAIDFSAVLVSRIGVNLKPTYFEFVGRPIVLGHDVVALRLKPGISSRYFLAQLNSKLVQIQLEMFSSGNVIRRVTLADLWEINLPFPPLEEQDQLALELTALASEKAEALKQVQEAEIETKATEYNVVAAISHNLNQKLGSIENDFDTMLRFLKGKEQSGERLIFSEPIRRIQPGETPDLIPSLARLSDRLGDNLNSVYGTLKTVERILQKQRADVELTDIARFFRTEVKERFESPTLQVTIDAPKKALHVPIDRLALRDALDNLINNAQKHGFIEDKRVYHVNFSIARFQSESGNDYARIVYKNDGRPFPVGFSFQDYKRLASRAGKTKGSGIGGFFVARVIDLHGGEFNEITSAFDLSDFPVQFEILLPIDT